MRNPSGIAASLLTLIGLTLAVGVFGSGVTDQQPPARKKLLFLTHAALYKHSSLGPAEKAVTEPGTLGGFDVTTLEGYKQDIGEMRQPSVVAQPFRAADSIWQAESSDRRQS